MLQCRTIPGGMESEEEEEENFSSIIRTTQNLRIKLVPDLSTKAGINGEEFDCCLTEDIADWFTSLKTMWNTYHKSPHTINCLKTAYLSHENPLILALQLLANCPDWNNLKNKSSLSSFLMTTLNDLSASDPSISQGCTDNIRMVAFNFIKNCENPQVYDAVTKAFQLRESKEMFIDKIRELIDSHMYKVAAHWTINLNLEDHFTIYDMVVPLFLQDKPSLAEEYLHAVVDQQIETVRLLDSFLDRSKTILEHWDPLITKYKYIEICSNKLEPKTLSKLVGRLAKKYKIPSELTPFLNLSKSVSYIHYLINKIQSKKINLDSWRELIKDTAINPQLQKEVIVTLSKRGVYNEAIYWFKAFNYPLNELPSSVQEDVSRRRNINYGNLGKYKIIRSPEEFNKNDYYQLTISEDQIIIVDTNKKMENMMKELKSVQVVGFDSEWKPSVTSVVTVNLLQLAIPYKVFLIDCISTEITKSYWEQLGNAFFNNVEILKLGFSLEHDFFMLQKSLPMLGLNLGITTSYLDLQTLWRKLKLIQTFKFPYVHSRCAKENFATLVTLCLGKPLDKSNQMSDWAQRPLRKEQILYAALDAYCLVEIYNVIQKQLKVCECDHLTDITNMMMPECNTTKLNQTTKIKLENNDNKESLRWEEKQRNN